MTTALLQLIGASQHSLTQVPPPPSGPSTAYKLHSAAALLALHKPLSSSLSFYVTYRSVFFRISLCLSVYFGSNQLNSTNSNQIPPPEQQNNKKNHKKETKPHPTISCNQLPNQQQEEEEYEEEEEAVFKNCVCVFLSLELLLWLLLLLLLLLLLSNNNSTFSAINQFYNYQNSYSPPTIAMILSLSLSLSPCERAPQPWQHQKATENTPTWELHCGSSRER
jgi:hypothetical protein